MTALDWLISIFTAFNNSIAECFGCCDYTAAKLVEWVVMAEHQGRRG